MADGIKTGVIEAAKILNAREITIHVHPTDELKSLITDLKITASRTLGAAR